MEPSGGRIVLVRANRAVQLVGRVEDISDRVKREVTRPRPRPGVSPAVRAKPARRRIEGIDHNLVDPQVGHEHEASIRRERR